MNISFRKLTDADFEFKQLHKWCSQKFIYEWFEQRVLSYDEIVSKYTYKLNSKKQHLFIIQCDNKDIGFMQIYRFENDIYINIGKYNNGYEYDLFIGEEEYLSKGIGTNIIKDINNMIYSKYNADAIILRPFKRNIRAIKCYKKCDYEIISEYNGTDTIGNPEIITVLLNKKNTNN